MIDGSLEIARSRMKILRFGVPVSRPGPGCLTGGAADSRATTYAGVVHAKRTADPNAKRPKVTNKRMDELIQKCWEQGWWCERGGKNHVKCYPPNDQAMVPIPSTPSGSRTCRPQAPGSEGITFIEP